MPKSAQTENPFYVLGLRPGCGRAEIEREGQKLLGMLELGLGSAARYATPLGEQPRDAERVRWAMAELRDPGRRLAHELWARLPGTSVAPAAADEPVAEAAPWPEALLALGYGVAE